MRFSSVCLLAAAALAGGCSRVPESTFTLRTDAEKLDLPATHKQQIADTLEHFHGTPDNPRMLIPAADDVGADAEKPQATTAANAKPATISIARIDKPGYDRLRLKLGHQVYTAQCAGCHGTTGDGKGPAGQYLNPPPRDYRNGVFKFTSTPRGEKPRREDLRRILRYGARGTSMPAFRFLPQEETEAVIDYVQVLSARGELELTLIREATDELLEDDDFDPETVAGMVTTIAKSWDRAEGQLVRAVTVEPPRTPDSIRAGAVHFAGMYCVKCHNRDARGSKTADVGVDIWGRVAYPADLSMGMLHGGRRSIDIYRRIYSGINGTPMPSSKDPDSTKKETAEERSQKIWELVHFVTTVIENNGIPAAEQQLIDETLQRRSAPAQPEQKVEEAPAKAADLSPQPADLALTGALR
ncbi:MAG: c-type cytochrome [Planctomycetia bacterium]